VRLADKHYWKPRAVTSPGSTATVCATTTAPACSTATSRPSATRACCLRSRTRDRARRLALGYREASNSTVLIRRCWRHSMKAIRITAMNRRIMERGDIPVHEAHSSAVGCRQDCLQARLRSAAPYPNDLRSRSSERPDDPPVQPRCDASSVSARCQWRHGIAVWAGIPWRPLTNFWHQEFVSFSPRIPVPARGRVTTSFAAGVRRAHGPCDSSYVKSQPKEI
jgi:hypothetical protein